jgi:hypothetical protein
VIGGKLCKANLPLLVAATLAHLGFPLDRAMIAPLSAGEPRGSPDSVSRLRSSPYQGTSMIDKVADDAGGNLGWIKWVILAAIVLALGYCMMNRSLVPTPPAANAHLSLANEAGKLVYSGVVGNTGEQGQIVAAIKAVFGDTASGEIKVDRNTKAAPWLGALAGFLPKLQAANGAHVDFDGNTVSLAGTLSDKDKHDLSETLHNLYGAFMFHGLEAPVQH